MQLSCDHIKLRKGIIRQSIFPEEHFALIVSETRTGDLDGLGQNLFELLVHNGVDAQQHLLFDGCVFEFADSGAVGVILKDDAGGAVYGEVGVCKECEGLLVRNLRRERCGVVPGG